MLYTTVVFVIGLQVLCRLSHVYRFAEAVRKQFVAIALVFALVDSVLGT